MAKERMVTRTIIKNKIYKVYKLDGTNLVELGEESIKGKVSEKELALKYGVDKVVIDCIKEERATYGMTVENFMEFAELVKEDTINLK